MCPYPHLSGNLPPGMVDVETGEWLEAHGGRKIRDVVLQFFSMFGHVDKVIVMPEKQVRISLLISTLNDSTRV
jgi:hypothetical protein